MTNHTPDSDLGDIKEHELLLVPSDIAYLKQRGVDPEFAVMNGLHSVKEDKDKNEPEGLCIPYQGANGRIVHRRIRIHEGKGAPGQRFWIPPGSSVHPYLPQIVPASVWNDTTIPIAIVEGPVKALALCLRGIPTIGLGGIKTGHDTKAWEEHRMLRLHGEFERVALKGRRVVVYFDAGLRNNPDVVEGASRMAFALQQAGANVFLTCPPPKKNGEDRGPDDYLVAEDGGEEATRKILDRAPVADPLLRLRGLQKNDKRSLSDAAKEILSRPRAAGYIKIAKRAVGGNIYIDQIKNELKRCGLSKGAIKDALDLWEAVKQQRVEARAKENGHDPKKEDEAPSKPVIVVDDDPEVVTVSAMQALVRRHRVYTTGGILIELNVDGLDGEITVSPVLPGRLFVMLGATIDWRRRTEEGLVATIPPPWVVRAILDTTFRPVVPKLKGIVHHPFLRCDGSLWFRGYDATTGTYSTWDWGPKRFDDTGGRPQAQQAAAALLQLVSDFPFASDAHKSAWLAALLTGFARPAIHGNVPLFVFDGNIPGVGKTLLYMIIAHIVCGRDILVMPYAGMHDAEEKKLLTSVLLESPEMALFDNVRGPFGSGALDMLVTTGAWSDRALGGNRMVHLQVRTIFFVDGNNVQFKADDTARRVSYVRLHTDEETPELRTGFTIPNLLEHVRAHRDEYVTHALTILRAYSQANRPDQDLSAWGSFNEWSAIVRGAIVWMGLPDPAETREMLRENTTVESTLLADLMAGWAELCEAEGEPIAAGETTKGVTVVRALEVLKLDDECRRRGPSYEETMEPRESAKYPKLRGALGTLCNVRPGMLPPAQSVFYKFRALRGRNVGGRALDRNPGGERVWFVRVISAPETPKATTNGTSELSDVCSV